MSRKHVWNLGRWRIAWRFGRYRTGLHRGPYGKVSFALPFVWVNVIRRVSS